MSPQPRPCSGVRWGDGALRFSIHSYHVFEAIERRPTKPSDVIADVALGLLHGLTHEVRASGLRATHQRTIPLTPLLHSSYETKPHGDVFETTTHGYDVSAPLILQHDGGRPLVQHHLGRHLAIGKAKSMGSRGTKEHHAQTRFTHHSVSF